jgi:hypothetical protein
MIRLLVVFFVFFVFAVYYFSVFVFLFVSLCYLIARLYGETCQLGGNPCLWRSRRWSFFRFRVCFLCVYHLRYSLESSMSYVSLSSCRRCNIVPKEDGAQLGPSVASPDDSP